VLSRIRQETEAQWDNRDGVFRGLVLTERGGVACGGIRYNFGTTKGEISGERPCKRRSAKHLEFLPSLLEGRRSIQLSYGRITLILGYLCLGRTSFWVNGPLLEWQTFIPDTVGKLR
jgi:hypothetical protein